MISRGEARWLVDYESSCDPGLVEFLIIGNQSLRDGRSNISPSSTQFAST